MSTNRKQQLKELQEALGALAESSLLFFKAALGAGASAAEALQLTQAYMVAMLQQTRTQNKEGDDGTD